MQALRDLATVTADAADDDYTVHLPQAAGTIQASTWAASSQVSDTYKGPWVRGVRPRLRAMLMTSASPEAAHRSVHAEQKPGFGGPPLSITSRRTLSAFPCLTGQ